MKQRPWHVTRDFVPVFGGQHPWDTVYQFLLRECAPSGISDRGHRAVVDQEVYDACRLLCPGLEPAAGSRSDYHPAVGTPESA